VVNAVLYLEGGGESKYLHARCREGFRKLLEKCGYSQQKRMPRLVACGSRGSALDDFAAAHMTSTAKYVGLLLDSEDPVADIERTWAHIKARDNREKPQDAHDEQVLFMTTCMETWLVADHDALSKHYGSQLQISALPALHDLEKKSRHKVQDKLAHATRNTSKPFAKGQRSFDLLGELNPSALEKLPSFARARRILNKNL
jgi:hypothetical protein